MNNEDMVSASELLQKLVDKTKDQENISLREINQHLSKCGFSILMILFAFPMAIPFPYPPGFTTVLGIPILIFSIQMMFGMKNPLLPNWIAQKTIKSAHLAFAVKKTHKYFVFLERKMKVRIPYFSSSSGEIIIGFVSFICSIAIVLPIMFGNAVPSAGICIMALGLLEKDGLVIIFGIIVSVVGIFVASMVVYLFFWGAKLAAGGLLTDMYNYIHLGK
jgi:hypothetical protein